MGRREVLAALLVPLRFPQILLTAFVLEIGNLFAITVSQGYVQFPPLPIGRFESFAGHAILAWLFLAAHQIVTKRGGSAETRRTIIAELAIVALCLVGWRLYFEYGVRLSADGPHYFAQARSILFDFDLDFTNDYEGIRPRIEIAERYPVGLALLSLPFLTAAHVLVRIATMMGYDLPAEGFGYPYETAFELTSYLFASVALVYLLRSITALVPLSLATLALVSASLASFLGWYMVLEPGMPHAMSFAWATFFLGYWLETRPVTRARDWVVLGALIGVAALVRWQNGVFILLPLLDDWIDQPRSFRSSALMGAAAGIVFLPQLVFWFMTTGNPFALPTGGHEVSWEQMRVMEVMYSTNRGLFPWNPILYLGVIGLALWLVRSRRLAALFLTGFFLQAYVNGSVGIWWAGWSFGGRRFDSCFLFFVVGLAVLLDFLRRRPMIPLVSTLALLIVWNLTLIRQARDGLVPPDRLVSFREVSQRSVDELYARVGYPFASPANWLFAARHGVSPEKFDELFGHEGFGNFRSSFDASIESYVASGLGPPERDGAGRWFRWSMGSQSRLLIPLKAARSYELSVELRPFAGAIPNHLSTSINGSVQPGRPLSAPTTLRWTLDSELWSTGINEISFNYGRTVRPSELGAATDSRELAVAFYRIELVALADDDN